MVEGACEDEHCAVAVDPALLLQTLQSKVAQGAGGRGSVRVRMQIEDIFMQWSGNNGKKSNFTR